MIFNGHKESDINEIDEETFTEIQVMYSDGLLGNKGIFDALTPITTAIFNYLRASNVAPIKPATIFPWVTEYGTNPDDDPVVNDPLITFLSQAPGFSLDKFSNG